MDQSQDNPKASLSAEEKLNNMASDAADLNKEVGFMDPGAERKRKSGSGRHKKDCTCEKCVARRSSSGPSLGRQRIIGGPGEELPRPQVDPIQELMPVTTGLVSFYSNWLVQIAEDERARLTKEKSDVLAHTSAVCLNQYFPGVLGSHAALIVLCVTVAETSFAAVKLRRENLEKMKAEARRQQGVNQNSVRQNVQPLGGENLAV